MATGTRDTERQTVETMAAGTEEALERARGGPRGPREAVLARVRSEARSALSDTVERARRAGNGASGG